MENKEGPGSNGGDKKGVLEKASDFVEKITRGIQVPNQTEVSHFDPEDVDDEFEVEPEYDEDDPMADV